LLGFPVLDPNLTMLTKRTLDETIAL
jgi:hypothetical protein